ncbi:hypothetical protein Tco_0030743 [Tanacetum coccineum]
MSAKDYYSEDQYAVSIQEYTAYPCLHSPKTTKERRSIRCIQKKSIRRIEDIVCEYSVIYQTLSLLQDTPIRHIQSLGYADGRSKHYYRGIHQARGRKSSKTWESVWEIAKYGKIWYDEDIHDLRSVETEFPAIAFNDGVSSEKIFSCEPTVSSLNDEIDFRISFDDSDNEDYTVIFDKNSFSYKKNSTNDLKTDSENDNEKVNLPSLLSPEPTVSCFDDLDFFKDFENEFPAIVYNVALTSKSDFLTKPIVSPQHIDEFNLKYEISLSECDEEEQNILYFNDIFSFNVIYPDDSKLDEDNDDDKIDIEHSSGDLSVKPLPDVIYFDVDAYAHGSNKLSETIITEYLVNISKRHAFWSLNEDILKITILTTNTPYPSRKIRRIRACTHQRPQRKEDQYAVSREDQYAVLDIWHVNILEDIKRGPYSKKLQYAFSFLANLLQVNMDDPNITMEEYIRLEEEKAHRRAKVYNWETATYGKIWGNEDVHDLRSVETKFPAIVFNDMLTSEETLFCEPTVSSLNDNEIDFKIPFDESDDEDYTKEFSAIVYNDALTSKSDFSTKATLCPQHINKFNLNDETSLSKCDEEEQNILYFNDVFPFNVIYPDDSKSDKDNDDDKIDIKRSLGDMSVKPLPGLINTDVGAYAQGTAYTAYSLNEYSIFDTGPREGKSTNIGGEFTNLEILKCWSLETSRRLFNINSCLINLHGESTKQNIRGVSHSNSF